jgi:hypothetical protein
MHCIAEGPTRQTARTSPATAKEHVQITPARAALDHNDDEPEAKKPAEESPPQRTTYVRAPPVAIACLNRTDRTAMMPRWLNTARHRPHYHQAPDPAGGTRLAASHRCAAAAASAARVVVRAARSFRRELAVSLAAVPPRRPARLLASRHGRHADAADPTIESTITVAGVSSVSRTRTLTVVRRRSAGRGSSVPPREPRVVGVGVMNPQRE